MSDTPSTSCPKCGDAKGSCAPAPKVQNGKGDAPRNMSTKFRSNYDGIKWGSSSRASSSASSTKKKSKKASR